MASTFNAFEALKASGELSSKAASKKNKKNKSKGKNQKPEADENGTVPPSNVETAPVVTPAAVPVPVTDAAPDYERLAKQAESGASKVKLWKEWIFQAADEDTGADFKKAYLRTRALELTLENCLKSQLTSQQETVLHQFLATFLPFGDGYITQRLCSAIAQLSSLDLDAAPDVKSLALHSVHQLAAWLKTKAAGASNGTSNDLDAWLTRVNDIDRHLLQKGGSLKVIGPTVGKEHVSCLLQMLKLQEEKVDLLKPGAVPSGTAMPPAPPALLSCFQNLREAIGSHLQYDSQSNGARGGYGYERQQMLGAYQREETVLKQQAATLNAQIKQLESQLQLLRSDAKEVADKLAQVQNMQKSNAPAAQTQELGLPLASAHAALEAAETLSSLVDGSSRNGIEQQLLSVQQAQGNAPVDYIGLARSYLAMNLSLLGELPQKVDFCKQRIARAEKMISLSGSGSSKILETNRKQKEESEKLMDDTLKWAADAIDTTKEVVKNLNDRYPILLRVAPTHADVLAQEYRAIDELAARIQLQYSLVTQAVHSNGTPAAPAPIPAAPAVPAVPAVPAGLMGQLNLGPSIGSLLSAPVATPPPAPIAKPEPVAAPTTKAPGPAKPAQPAAAPQSNGAPPAPRPVSTRSWAKVEAVPAPAADSSLPTPAEALRSAETAEGSKGRRRRA